MAVITAGELNYIIYRYLTESGFMHTAFMFECEAQAKNSPVDGNLIPGAALFKLIHKGLQCMAMEENLKKGENAVDKEFSFLKAMDLIKKDEENVQKIVSDKKKHYDQAAKLGRKRKLRKARQRGEADRRAWEKEEADRKAWEKEEAHRKAQENEEIDRVERHFKRTGLKSRGVVRYN